MLLLLLAACDSPAPPVTPPAPAASPPAAVQTTAPASCTLLAVNDTYRIEPNADGSGGMARLAALRADLAKQGDVVLLHAGDFLYPSLMSRLYKGAQMVEVLNVLDGNAAAADPKMFVTFGNHEFDASKQKDAAALAERITGSQFTWLGSNVRFKADAGLPARGTGNLADTATVACGDLKLGIFSVTTEKKSAEYLDGFDDAATTARRAAAELRAAGADVVVALTHQSVDEDKAMLAALGEAGPDLVIGGHEHKHVQVAVDGRPIYKADADAESAWRVVVQRGNGGGAVREAELLELSASLPENPMVREIVDARIRKHDADFCAARSEAPGCLSAELGSSTVPLVASELEIRRFETNLGDWIADRARDAFPDAQIAMINSGSLRLNHDLAAGPIPRQAVEELFAYPTPLVRIEIDGATLEKVLARSAEDWTGNGNWLQVSGLAFVHDPATTSGSRLTLLSTRKTIAPTDKLVAVVPGYLVDPSGDRDGYTMLPNIAAPTGPDLKDLVVKALAAGPIAPVLEGRICNPERPGPCLAAP